MKRKLKSGLPVALAIIIAIASITAAGFATTKKPALEKTKITMIKGQKRTLKVKNAKKKDIIKFNCQAP